MSRTCPAMQGKKKETKLHCKGTAAALPAICAGGSTAAQVLAAIVGADTLESQSRRRFRVPRKLTDHAPFSLGNAGKKKRKKKESQSRRRFTIIAIPAEPRTMFLGLIEQHHQAIKYSKNPITRLRVVTLEWLRESKLDFVSSRNILSLAYLQNVLEESNRPTHWKLTYRYK